jgi:CBS domain-containing protein
MPVVIFNREFETLRDSDSVADATRRMLENRMSDLPVVDAAGKLVGLLKLERVLAALLPTAALLGAGIPDLAFVSDDLDDLRDKMREIDSRLVREFAVMPEHVVYPDTPPLEIVLQLHRGANNLPVVERGTGKLVGTVSARDVLSALHRREQR